MTESKAKSPRGLNLRMGMPSFYVVNFALYEVNIPHLRCGVKRQMVQEDRRLWYNKRMNVTKG